MSDEPLVIEVDPDRFMSAAYEPTLEMLSGGVPATAEELVPGDPRTLVRVFDAGLPMMQLLALESVCAALEQHAEGPERTKALQDAVRDWEPIWRALPELGETSVGLDGQGLRLDMTALEGHWR